ncbi:hypothetical protein TanjilG_31954 [Lupinus angustifolius]|uniref:Uncharacterized protein n=1 Tax=Lupinus angustifolius TaxID=3871 RepID=A0A394D936_LUPAN|nr:hypothetical protein TanjilG_31954 [Lupinus angustifolius]
MCGAGNRIGMMTGEGDGEGRFSGPSSPPLSIETAEPWSPTTTRREEPPPSLHDLPGPRHLHPNCVQARTHSSLSDETMNSVTVVAKRCGGGQVVPNPLTLQIATIVSGSNPSAMTFAWVALPPCWCRTFYPVYGG